MITAGSRNLQGSRDVALAIGSSPFSLISEFEKDNGDGNHNRNYIGNYDRNITF